MKKLLLALLISGSAFSQTSDEKMNIVKTNVTAYAFRNVNLTYERVLSKRFSLNVGYGTMIKGTVPFGSTFIKDTEFSDAEVSVSNFTFEPRIYLGAGYGKGFYIAPYYRHTAADVDQIVLSFNYNNGLSDNVKIAGKATGNSGGIMVGTKWFLGKSDSWVLDFWILGAHYGKGNGDFRGTSLRTLSPDEQAQLKEKIENLDIPFVKYTVTTDANGANAKVDGPWAGVRSGLSFGYRF